MDIYMTHLIRKRNKVFFFMGFVLFVFFYSITAEARLFDDVTIDTIDGGYEVKINFELLIKYQSHSPDKVSDFFRVELVPVNLNRLDGMAIESLKERSVLGWNRRTGIPLKDLTYEGGDPEHPQMTFTFTKEVEFSVRNGIDLKSLIITIKTNTTTQAEDAITEVNQEKLDDNVIGEASAIEKDIEAVVSDKIDTILENNGVNFMDMAKVAMIDGNYSQAIRYYTKILRKAKGETKKQAQELLGLARERNDQFAHAKSEYKKYLNNYPLGPDAVRVRQRLAGLVTAAKKPKKRIVKVKKSKKIEEKPKWKIRNYGSYSNFYYRDQTSRDGETRVNRNDIMTNLNLNSKWTNEDYDMRFKYSGRHQREFLSDELGDNRLSALSFEVRHKKSNLYGKIGRQRRNSGGVLGRFDGMHISYDITPKIVVNGVFGFPVDSTKQIGVETDKRVYGVSADFGTYNEHWDYTAFVVAQDDGGMIDRFAIGGEVRYFDSKKSFYSLFDYDLYFKEMNIFLFNGTWSLASNTTLNLRYDFRRSPLLTANNAIQGQGVAELNDLSSRYTDDEIRELAVDRSAISKTFNFGVTHKFSDDIQLINDFTVSRREGTVASGGVGAMPGSGNEYYYSTRLNINNVFFENDSIVNGLRFSDTSRRNTYSYDISTRIPFNRKFRIIPRYRINYRAEKANDDNSLTMQPRMRVDYRLTKWARLEVEGGIEWKNDYISGISKKATRSFFSFGYRVTF
jgi:tetratricopeptide (TPR) repeat protein